MNNSDDITGNKAATRGRPREFDREAALDAATRLFWQKGYTATSMADLTAAMGIGSPSLYAAFGSKEALYVAVVHYYVEHYGGRLWSRFTEAATARQAVEAYLLDSAASLPGSVELKEPAGCMLIFSAVAGEGFPALGELVTSLRRLALKRVEERLQKGVETGEISTSADITALARFFVAVQGGMALQARDGASRPELESIALEALKSWDAKIAERSGQ